VGVVTVRPERVHGLLESKNFSVDNLGCADLKCTRAILPGVVVFVDVGGRVFCEGCGKALRYHRKKAAQRGETYIEGE